MLSSLRILPRPELLRIPPDRGSRLRRLWLRRRLAVADLRSVIRRAIDIIAGLMGGIALLPVFLVAALAIKLSSRGPVFFWQERIGKNGRPFRMPKLRTMIVDADKLKTALAEANVDAVDGVRFKLENDPRVTSVGRVLRRFSVDELPQLWNLVEGSMTIVGPRPPLHREVKLYDARAARRLEVKPGLTCLWQISGRSDLSFDEQIKLDIEYIDHGRLRDDIGIVVRTVPAVLTGRGAY